MQQGKPTAPRAIRGWRYNMDAMTKDQLLDKMHYIAGVLALLVLDGKFEAAAKLAKEVNDISCRLNQVVVS